MTKSSRKLGKKGRRRSPRISALEAHAHAYGSVEESSSKTDPSYSTLFMPQKRILEHVLDTLQRRDTYEIFAEPVDPNEVEDYYAIIEEPMDFGTMRAKLHEGMYKSMEQFEHDVFLIFNNAMHFNSSGTIYFRQARAINELARKVFDVLKTNPDKFELEFSETKRKAVGRRNPGDSEEIAVDVSPNSVSCSSRSTSHRKSFKATNHGCSDIAKQVDDGRDHLGVHIGAKDHSSRHRSSEGYDKRFTYYTPPLSISEDESIFSTVYGGKLKLQLQCDNQQDVGYRDSLMLFVKDLGPTAQNVAKRKLLGCEIRTAAASATTCALWRPQSINNNNTNNNEMRSSGNLKGKMHLQIAPGGETAYISDETETDQVEEGTILLNHSSRGSSLLGCDKGGFPKSVTTTGDVSLKISKPNHQAIQVAPSYVFTLPYLKTRLDQINASSSEQYSSFSQQDSSSSSAKKRPFLSQFMRY